MTRHHKRKPRHPETISGAEPLPWVPRLFKLAKRIRSVDPSRRSPTRQTADFANRLDWLRANFDHAIHCNAIERFASKKTTGKPLINYERPGIVRNRPVGVKLNFLELKNAFFAVFINPDAKRRAFISVHERGYLSNELGMVRFPYRCRAPAVPKSPLCLILRPKNRRFWFR